VKAVLDLFLASFSLMLKIVEAIKEEADREMLNTVESVRDKMVELQLSYELNNMGKTEYEEAMKLLENRLRELEVKTE